MPHQRAMPLAVMAALGCWLVVMGRAQQADKPGGSLPRFSVSSDLVLLHVNVHDRGGKPVSGLTQNAFAVYEDGRPQPITLFSGEDAPVTAGLVMDSSVSIWPIRDLVIAGAMAFAQASNPKDELFAVAFNEDVRAVLPPEAPFTNDIPLFRAAVARALVGRGLTALFDAISASLAYSTHGSHARKVLVIVSDGGDNASQASAEDIMTRAEASNVVMYSVAVVDAVANHADPRMLKRLAERSGGESFAPRTAAEVDRAFRTIAREIRESYTIGYVPDRPADDTFRQVRVAASTGDGRTLSVRTRAGYLASTSRRTP